MPSVCGIPYYNNTPRMAAVGNSHTENASSMCERMVTLSESNDRPAHGNWASVVPDSRNNVR